MHTKKASFLRGKRMRITSLDTSGRPVFGDSAVVITKGFITLKMTTNTTASTAITVTNAGGEACVSEPTLTRLASFGVEADFCDVDFAAFEALTGQTVVLDANGLGVGITESTDTDLSLVRNAIELWTGSSSSNVASAGATGEFGYVLLPNVGGGVISDVAVADASITFTIKGMETKNGTAWGAGPHKVELVAGVPAVLSTPMKANDHRRVQIVEVAPPATYVGAIPLLDPSAPAITSVTGTVTVKSVAFAPTPAGATPVWYEFGDGTWDYSPTGSYTHVYATAGTWQVTAHRGSTSATTSVTTT